MLKTRLYTPLLVSVALVSVLEASHAQRHPSVEQVIAQHKALCTEVANELRDLGTTVDQSTTGTLIDFGGKVLSFVVGESVVQLVLEKHVPSGLRHGLGFANSLIVDMIVSIPINRLRSYAWQSSVDNAEADCLRRSEWLYSFNDPVGYVLQMVGADVSKTKYRSRYTRP